MHREDRQPRPDLASTAATARGRARVVAALIALGLIAAGVGWWRLQAPPKRFGEVVPGRLYRSGTITPRQLARLKERYDLRSVLSLLNPDAPESVAERGAAEALGLNWINVPLPGNGASTPAERERIKAVLFEPRSAPLLVHCAAGANRTGLAIALYRLHREGWTLEQVLDEMRRFGFEDAAHHQELRDALAAEAASAAQRRQAPP